MTTPQALQEFMRALAKLHRQLGPDKIAVIERAIDGQEIQAAILARGCYCFCQARHPDDTAICTWDTTTTVRLTSKLTGPVDVAFCQPCATAALARKRWRPPGWPRSAEQLRKMAGHLRWMTGGGPR